MKRQPMKPIRATSESLSQDVVLSSIDPWGRVAEVPTTLSYRAEDPYAVALVFHSDSPDVEWVVARTLLLQGLAAPTGDGDVRAHPGVDEDGGAVTVLDFRSPDGRLVAHLDAHALQAFLARSFAMVPVGTESAHLDMDAMIAAILRAA